MLSPFGGFGLGGFGMAPMAPMGGLFADLNSFGGGGGMNVQTFQTTMGGPGVRSSSTSTKFINGKKITTQRYDSKTAHFVYCTTLRKVLRKPFACLPCKTSKG